MHALNDRLAGWLCAFLVAMTLAQGAVFDGAEDIGIEHLAEAIQYRTFDPTGQ